MITQERLKELMSYDRETGEFTRIKHVNSVAKVGFNAGNLNARGYLHVMIDRRHYPLHRLAWLYEFGMHPQGQIDHINHIRVDNRINNLRDVDCSGNHKNLSLSQRNKSGITGVHWSKANGRWKAQIRINREQIYLGFHDDMNAAIMTRKLAEFAYGFHRNHGKGDLS